MQPLQPSPLLQYLKFFPSCSVLLIVPGHGHRLNILFPHSYLLFPLAWCLCLEHWSPGSWSTTVALSYLLFPPVWCPCLGYWSPGSWSTTVALSYLLFPPVVCVSDTGLPGHGHPLIIIPFPPVSCLSFKHASRVMVNPSEALSYLLFPLVLCPCLGHWYPGS
jgi:hypothetical protein